MIDIDTSDRWEQRKFGLVMAAAIAVLGAIRWGWHWAFHDSAPFPVYFCAVAAVFLILALVWPRALQPIFVAWMKLALVLNFIVMHLLLGIAFYLLITPGRGIMRLFRDDPLKRAWRPDTESYWEPAEDQSEDFDRYRKQF